LAPNDEVKPMLNAFLLKRLAVALTVSQIVTHPTDIKTKFDPEADQKAVVEIMNKGCQHIFSNYRAQYPEMKDVDPDQMILTQIENAKALNQKTTYTNGVRMAEARAVYQYFCLNKTPDPADLNTHDAVAELINYYNEKVRDLPDVQTLKGWKLGESSLILDGSGKRFTDVYSEHEENRRRWVPLSKIPLLVQNAFIAAEDKNFRNNHIGIDENGIARAAGKNASEANGSKSGGKRDEGGSTIDQQVIKNTLLKLELAEENSDEPGAHDRKYDRKMREMILATRMNVQNVLTKDEILEIYLNVIFLGRASWGVEMAAQSYFNKSLADLTPTEAAFLAGMTKGPSAFNPDHNKNKSDDRTGEVLAQMRKLDFISADEFKVGDLQIETLHREPFESPRDVGGFYFTDAVNKQLIDQLKINPKKVAVVAQATIHRDLQRSEDSSLQEGLAQYHINFEPPAELMPEFNLSLQVAKLFVKPMENSTLPPWQQALIDSYPPLYDVQWPVAIILKTGKNGVTVGLKDGRKMQLVGWRPNKKRNFKLTEEQCDREEQRAQRLVNQSFRLNDVVHVKVLEEINPVVAEIRFRPTVQGAALVMENSTGKILAMAGGFSRPLDQYNRALLAKRQAGSTVKPLTYLAALQAGLQENTLIKDEPIDFEPIGNNHDSFTPINFDTDKKGYNFTQVLTMRHALETSNNRATSGLLNYIVADDGQGEKWAREKRIREQSFARVRTLMQQCGVSENPPPFYPTILGSLDVRIVDMATCYATIANLGRRPTAHFLESVQKDGKLIHIAQPGMTVVQDADAVSFFQLRSMMQGVMARGTAQPIKAELQDLIANQSKDGEPADISEFVAAKTGTTNKANDAWFIGITNDVTIAVWVGYDKSNEDHLSPSATGSGVAGPIFASILRNVAKVYPMHRLFNPPTAVAKQLLAVPTETVGGRFAKTFSGPGIITEFIRRDNFGQPINTWQKIVQIEIPSRVQVADRSQEDVEDENGNLSENDENVPLSPPQERVSRARRSIADQPNEEQFIQERRPQRRPALVGNAQQHHGELAQNQPQQRAAPNTEDRGPLSFITDLFLPNQNKNQYQRRDDHYVDAPMVDPRERRAEPNRRSATIPQKYND
jgi:membrane carboxypeptidase/penicillin-binding protein